MLSKHSKIYSVLHGTCPRCHEGKVFVNKSPYSSWDFTNMHNNCSCCGQSFDPEPGFYQGAMYVSYAFTIGLAFMVSVVMLLFFSTNPYLITGVLTVILLVLLPVIFRVSRIVWLHLFIKYKP
jgi:uncharacterized protein (DUF983 family)